MPFVVLFEDFEETELKSGEVEQRWELAEGKKVKIEAEGADNGIELVTWIRLLTKCGYWGSGGDIQVF